MKEPIKPIQPIIPYKPKKPIKQLPDSKGRYAIGQTLWLDFAMYSDVLTEIDNFIFDLMTEGELREVCLDFNFEVDEKSISICGGHNNCFKINFVFYTTLTDKEIRVREKEFLNELDEYEIDLKDYELYLKGYNRELEGYSQDLSKYELELNAYTEEQARLVREKELSLLNELKQKYELPS
jgi:hypothetical protein